MTKPAVSVIIAAYGRSNVLRYAIQSVQYQTFSDWEIIVVDDASPDDSVAVAESFGNPRIRTVRITQNVGEQSGPNNLGALMAAAPLIAFLNQDDLWWPDHLEHLVALHRSTGAPIVHSVLARKPLPSSGGDSHRLVQGLLAWHDPYHPRYDVPASCWLVERRLHLGIGGWRPSTMLHFAPSQDFLFRAWRAGARIEPSGVLSVLQEGAGAQPGSYTERHEQWQSCLWQRLLDDPAALRAEIMRDPRLIGQRPKRPPRRPLRFLRWARTEAAVWVVTTLGRSPFEWQHRRIARGGFVQQLRATRGLDARPPGYEPAPPAGGGRGRGSA